MAAVGQARGQHMDACNVDLEPWQAVDAASDGDSFFYVKFALDPSDQPPPPERRAEPAFVLLATDLLAVWGYTVSHDRARAWLKEQHSSIVADDYMGLFAKLRDVLLGINKQHAPRIGPSDCAALLVIDVPIATRVAFRLSCEPLAPAHAASVLREQMLLPALHMSALFAGRAGVGGWSAAQASHAAEAHANGCSSRLEFSGAIAAVYETIMKRRRGGHGALPPPGPEPIAEPASEEPRTVAAPAVEPAVVPAVGAKRQLSLTINKARPKGPDFLSR